MLSKVVACAGWCLLLVPAVTGCDRTPASVQVTPSSVLLTRIGETESLEAAVFTSSGKPLKRYQSITWTSESPEVFDVDQEGVVRCLSEGRGNLTVTAGASVATVPVTARLVSSLKVRPATAKMSLYGRLTLEAIATDLDGKRIDDLIVDWVIPDPKSFVVAQVNTAGEVFALSEGVATVRAELSPATFETVTITVTKHDVQDETDYSFSDLQAADIAYLMEIATSGETHLVAPVDMVSWKRLLAIRALLLRHDLLPAMEQYLNDQNALTRRVAACILYIRVFEGSLKYPDLRRHIPDTPEYRSTIAAFHGLRLARVEKMTREDFARALDATIGELNSRGLID